jgi:valyl-tRNA synthetase
MVLMGLNNTGDIPFREVFIHPKILDGYGETMSKSKGNGVDPIDVIDKCGPDALRFGLTWLAAETQDVRMPVQFECPHCEAAINQTKENRERATIVCSSCKQAFSTQWAKAADEILLPRGAVISERFEVARNFCNKLWNAARFVMLHLEGFKPQSLTVSNLPLEDRWILSRLSTTIENVNGAISGYRFSDAARLAYEFAWDEFCSYYVEMAKPRLQEPTTRASTQQVLAHCLDELLRLLHPIIPFITEAIWQELAKFGSVRTLGGQAESQPWLMKSTWPEARAEHQDPTIEQQFKKFVVVLGALREIRSRQNIPPREEVTFTVACDPQTKLLLEPMEGFFKALANAHCTGLGSGWQIPEVPSQVIVDGMEVTLDLGKFIDVNAEIERNEKLLANVLKQISGKEAKLANQGFVARAPADVVEKERAGLVDLQAQQTAIEIALSKLRLQL